MVLYYENTVFTSHKLRFPEMEMIQPTMTSEIPVPRVQLNRHYQAQHLLFPVRFQQRFDAADITSSKYIYPNVDATNVIEDDEYEKEETNHPSSSSYSCSSSSNCLHVSDCAWPGDGPVDLSKVELTFEQKLWLTNQHLIHKVSVRELHEKYNIRIARLWYYINRVKNGTYFKEKRGRPYLLDKKSVISILESMFLQPAMSDQELRNVILSNHKQMYTRRTSNSSSAGPYKKISSGTVNKYVQDIRGWSSTYTEKRKDLDNFEEEVIVDNEAWNGCKVM